MFSTLALLVIAAYGQETPCFQPSFPPVGPSRSADRRAAIDDCTRLISTDPRDPRPYLYRGAARWIGPDPARGWNERPYYDLRVSEDPAPVISDYERALERLKGERALADPGVAWLRLGYLHASRGDWAAAALAWRRAAEFGDVAREARTRLHFAQSRLVSPDRLMATPPERCEGLPFWDCAVVLGCAIVVEGSDRAFRGCRGKPRGLEPGVRPKELDCSLLDESHCGETPRCRWRSSRLRGPSCAGAN